MDNSIEYRPVKRKIKGRLAQPRMVCGPGQNCKNSSAASARAISSILEHGKKVGSCSALDQCHKETVLPDYLQR